MATLEKIRNKAGLLVAVVGAALFAFIIGDLLNSSSSFMNSNQNNVIVVNGNAVDYQAYMNRENDLTDIYKLQMQSTNLPEMYINQIRQSVYEEIIMENLIDPRLKNLGMVVTPNEMTDMVEGDNISPVLLQNQMFQNQTTGMFDKNSIVLFLNQIKDIDSYPEEAQAQLLQRKTMWMFWEKNIKRNRLNEKYLDLLSKSIVVNSLEAKAAFNNSSVSSDITYVMEPLSGIADSTINVSKAEIEKLYHQQKERFRQQETCIIDYVAVDIVPSPDDYNKVDKEMYAIREEMETTDNIAALTNEKSETKFTNVFFSIDGYASDVDLASFASSAQIGDIQGPLFKNDQYRILKLVDKIEGPDSVKISEIYLSPRSSEAELKIYADSLLNALNNGGADFAEIVRQHSDGQNSEDTNGEIGWVTEAGALQGLNEDFRKAAFSLPVGKCEVVKSNYGLHIVKVTEKTKDVPKFKIADIVYTVTPSSFTRSQLFNSLNHFIASNNSPDKIAESAAENGYNLISNARVFSTDQTLGIITGARQVVRWAYNGKKGQVSDIIECDNKFVVASHRGRLPEGYQSIETVTPQLKAELTSKKKSEEIAANLKAKNLSSISAYANAMNTNPDTVKFITMETSRISNIGVEPKLNALIALAPVNSISAPVAGDNGVYVFEVINRTNSENVYDEKEQIKMLQSNNEYRINGYLFRYLQQDAKIEDNRIRFY